MGAGEGREGADLLVHERESLAVDVLADGDARAQAEAEAAEEVLVVGKGLERVGAEHRKGAEHRRRVGERRTCRRGRGRARSDDRGCRGRRRERSGGRGAPPSM